MLNISLELLRNSGSFLQCFFLRRFFNIYIFFFISSIFLKQIIIYNIIFLFTSCFLLARILKSLLFLPHSKSDVFCAHIFFLYIKWQKRASYHKNEEKKGFLYYQYKLVIFHYFYFYCLSSFNYNITSSPSTYSSSLKHHIFRT